MYVQYLKPPNIFVKNFHFIFINPYEMAE